MLADNLQAFLVFVVALLFLKLLMSYVQSPKNLPPGPIGIPLIGNMLSLGVNPSSHIQDIAKKYGPVASMYLGQKLVLVLSNYKVIKEAFIRQGDIFAERPDNFAFRVYDTEKGVIVSNGLEFKIFKSFMLTTMKDTGAQRNSLDVIVRENAEDFVKYLRGLNGKTIEVLESLGVSIANTYALLLLGKKFEKKDPWIVSLTEHFYQEQRAYGNGCRVYMPWTKSVPGLKEWSGEKDIREIKAGIHRLLEEEVKKIEKTYIPGTRGNFVQAWFTEAINRKEKNPDDDLFNRFNLRHNLDIIFAAGYETTVTTLRWVIIYFMKYPEIQEKLRQEVDDVIGRDRTPSMQDESRMPYVQATIHEVHRFATIAPLSVQHWTSEATTLFGYDIPKHTYVLPNILGVHSNPKHFPEPDKFKPERFIDANGKFIKDEKVIPFSMGKRACPGEPLAHVEIFLYVAYLIQNFIFKLPSHGDVSFDRYPSLSSNPKSFHTCFVPRT